MEDALANGYNCDTQKLFFSKTIVLPSHGEMQTFKPQITNNIEWEIEKDIERESLRKKYQRWIHDVLKWIKNLIV